jgi:hypothetical protein
VSRVEQGGKDRPESLSAEEPCLGRTMCAENLEPASHS